MRIIKIVAAAFLVASLMVQCAGKDESSFEVKVTYKNAGKIPGKDPGTAVRMSLQEVPYGGDNRPVMLDSVTLTGNDGKVSLQGNGNEEGIYELTVENGPVILLVNDEDEIEVNVDLSKKDEYYTISGSPASKELKEFIEKYSDRSIPVNLAFKELDSLKQVFAPDSLVLNATGKKNKAIKALNSYLQEFISGSSYPSVSLFALGMSSRSLPTSDFELLLNDVVKKFPDHKTLAALKTNYDKQKQQSSAEEQQAAGGSGWVGKQAPDLAMPSVNGDTLTISSFKGKYVLVDFWASWCGPCRAENPNVLKAYERYRNRNFTVLGVSLDQSREAWVKGISDDKLPWPQMSDLKFWDSKAVDVYKFQGIPYNVLIDPNGIIIAEGLRGFDLEKKLAEVIK